MSSGTGAGAVLRPPGGRQDRDDRQPRGRLVLRLHADARDGGLGRLPAGGEIPMTNVHGIAVAGRHLPGRRSGSSFMETALGTRRCGDFAPPRDVARRSKPFMHGQYALAARRRRPTTAARAATTTDDLESTTRPPGRADASTADRASTTAASGAARRRPTAGAAARRPPSRRHGASARPSARRPASAGAAAAPSSPPALGARRRGPRPRRGLRGRRVAARVEARPAERRPPAGDDAGPGSSSAAPSARSPSTSAGSVLLRRARRALARGAGARRGDPARAARRAAPALDRRVDVLGLRAHRRGARREPVHATAGGLPARSRVPVGRGRLARHDVGLRAGVHARVRAARARGRLVGRRGRVDLQDAGGRGAAGGGRARGRSARAAAARSRARSSAGTRCWPCTSRRRAQRRGWRRSCSRRSRLGAPGGGSWRASPGPRAILIKWVPLLFCRCGRSRRGRPARRSAHLGFASRPPRSLVASRRGGTATHWLGAFGPLARNANRETHSPSRTASRSSGFLARRRARLSPRCSCSPTSGSCARRGAAGPGSASRRAAAARDAVPRALVRGLGGPARRGRGRPRRAGARARLCAYCCARRSRLTCRRQTRRFRWLR